MKLRLVDPPSRLKMRHSNGAVDLFFKLLKINVFILQKNLDTALLRLIRFRQKVLTGFSLPLELFSLEEKAACCRAAFSFQPNICLRRCGVCDDAGTQSIE